MKLQKITQKRWFWPLVCAVSVVFGWWYLSIVTCAPLGGDDELINLQNYYYITHTSFGQSVLDYLGDLWEQFSLQNGRFRPFSSPPVRGLTSWFLGDLVGYRLYILAWTYADIVLTAWLVGKASRNKKLGIACLCLLPMMFSVWQDSTGNSLYSYGALVQSTLLPALVAGAGRAGAGRTPATSGGPCWRATVCSSAAPRLRSALPISYRFLVWRGSTPTRPATRCG